MKELEIEVTYKTKYTFNVDAKTDREALDIYERDKDKIAELLMGSSCLTMNVELTNISNN